MAASATSRPRPAPRDPQDKSGGTGNSRRRPGTRRVAPPLEHRILMTATLCLLAFGAVMVYSASSPAGALSGGYGTGEFITYLLAAALGLIAMRVCEYRGLKLLTE